MEGEQLVMVLHPDTGQSVNDGLRSELTARNQKLLPYKRIGGYLVWDEDFPRTASLKVKRGVLAEQIRERQSRDRVLPL